MLIDRGKFNIILGGSFGSEGKGLLAGFISKINSIDIAVTNQSPNSGHTCIIGHKKIVTRMLPICGILNHDSMIYFAPGTVIDTSILIQELAHFNIQHRRVYVHPNCGIIEYNDIVKEKTPGSGMFKIASTMTGTGQCRAKKIARVGKIARDDRNISSLVRELDLHKLMSDGKTCLMETGQGYGLSINEEFYPYCTSKSITVASSLDDAQVHPKFLGKVIVGIRAFPIRVGNIYDGSKLVGFSGPFYADGKETTFEQLGVPTEYTTVSGRPRRVGTFSHTQYKRVIDKLRPDYVFLNFVNYMTEDELNELLKLLPEVTHLGYGPDINDVISRNNRIDMGICQTCKGDGKIKSADPMLPCSWDWVECCECLGTGRIKYTK